MHYKCCEIVSETGGILRMNGFYCSVLITDCCYSFEYYCCICAVVDRVLMMMVMIMTLDVMKTRRKNYLKTFVFQMLTLV